MQLAQSPNTKIVIIGSGKDGLPVILGNVDTPMQPNPAAPGRRRATGRRVVPDNSEAAKQRPAAASPPLLEKTPASNLPSPSETAIADRGAARVIGQAAGRGHARHAERGHRRDDRERQRPSPLRKRQPGQEPRTSWTWSELQELISRTVGAGGSSDGPEPPLADVRTDAASGGGRTTPSAGWTAAAAAGTRAATATGRTAVISAGRCG